MMIDGMGRGAAMRPPIASEAGAKAPVKGEAVAAAGAPQGPAASTLGRIVGDLAAAPPVDVAKVEALRVAIASGAYKADPAMIADRMLALESVPKPE